MVRWLKQSTAVDVMLGPFVDDTDGKTTEEALTLSQADLHLSKNGAASAQKNDATAATHRYGGNYMVDLDATDTNTLGHLRLMCKESGALPVIADFMVLPAEAYDTLVGGTDNFTVDLSTQAKADVNAEADTALTDYDPPTRAELTSDINSLNDPTAAAIADAVLDEALSGHVTAGTLGKAVADIEADTSELQSDDIPTTLATLATSSALATVDANVDAILVDTGTTIPAQITALNDLSAADVNAEVDTALVDYDAATNADLGEAFAAYGPFHSGARNVEITEDNTSSSIKGSSFQGVENTGTYLDLKALRSEHEINSTGTGGAAVENDISIVYGADVGADSTAISANFSGRINGSNDTCVVYAYDFDAAGWDTLGDMTGTAETTNFPYSFPLYSRHTGTGADEGKVYIRFFANNQSSPSLHIDRLLITANSGAPTKAEFDAGLAALENISAADVNAEVDTALSDIHLDHLFATDYDPAAKPGTATALLNELVENDAGVSRFTANALEEGPTGGGASASAIADAVWDEALSGHTTAGSAGKALADIEADATAILEDTGTTIPASISALNDLSAAQVNAEVDTALADYDGPTKAELDAGLAALNDPTAASIADAVLDEALAGHVGVGSLGKAITDIEADTNELQSDDVPGLIAGLNDLSAADVNAQADLAISDAALATASALATVDANVDSILTDTGTTIPAQISGLNDPTAAAIADAVLDEATAGHTTPGTVGALLIDVLADTNELQADDVPALIAALENVSIADILQTQLTESYAADGVAPTLTQAVMLIMQHLTEFGLSGTTWTTKKLDGSTTAATFTIDDASDPTSMTRAT